MATFQAMYRKETHGDYIKNILETIWKRKDTSYRF